MGEFEEIKVLHIYRIPLNFGGCTNSNYNTHYARSRLPPIHRA